VTRKRQPGTRALRPYALLYMYRRRLRANSASELLAALGIAIAVALVLASTVAQSSIAGASGQVVRAVVGKASLQLRSADNEGFDESMLAKVEAIPGVKQAAPLLEQPATVTAAKGRHVAVDLAGTDVSLAVLDGLAGTLPLNALTPRGIGLSRAAAETLGIDSSARRGGEVTLQMRGRATRLPISAVLGPEAAGAISKALVAVMPLKRLQRLASMPGRVTRILVQTTPGSQQAVRRRLDALAGGRLQVSGADEDVTALEQALRPGDLASQLFAAIGALLGFLLAFNAMLLTVPERRQAIADLRLAGTRRGAIVQIVLFQALCLGIAASVIGLAAGYALSVWVFHQPTGYLAEAFTLNSGTVVGAGPVLLAGLGGVAATCLASGVPLLDLRRGRARDAVYRELGDPGNALHGRQQRLLFIAAVGVLIAATLVFVLAPSAAILAGAMLALATVLAVPLAFTLVLAAGRLIDARSQRLTSLPVALASLQATTLRSLALAATGAVALFGSVALGGARGDLLRGIRSFASSYVADANIWVSNPGDNQAVDTFFPDAQVSAIEQIPGVASVRSFQGGFVQLGDRRVWVIARPPNASREVLRTQLVAGAAAQAGRRLAAGGWIAISAQIAAEHNTGVGGTIALRTPTGVHRFRIAATTTNLAWPPGVIFMSTADYGGYWGTRAPTALGVDLRPGTSAPAIRLAIERALGPSSGLEVSLASTRASRIDALAGEGLGQLGEISTLLLLAAVAAMAAALASSIWQRRSALADLRLLGVKSARLRRILLLEATMMLGAGCVTGAAAGVYGQLVLDGYLKHVTGFPLARVATGARPFEVFALVLGLALVLVAAPGWLASRVTPALALEDR
jgi:putative ABC transport system permease protein